MALAALPRLCAAAEADPAFENQERWGTPWLLSEPEYPKAARERNITGFVDVQARVAGTGELKEVTVTPGAPEAEVFVVPVRDAARLWRLYAPLGKDCLPSGERVTTRVWFELHEGEPKIFVARGKMRPMPSARALKPSTQVQPRYPRRMLESGREAYVFARSEIDPAGKVVSITSTAFPREVAANLFDFETETRRALGAWTFPPAAHGESAPRFYCADVHFHLDN